MSVQLLIFDLDGVLVESEVLVSKSLSVRLAGIGIIIDPQAIIHRFHYTPFVTITKTLAAEQAVPIPSGFLDDLPSVYMQSIEELEAVAGADAALAALMLPKCIASGSRPVNLRRKLDVTGLLHHFDPHLFSSHHVSKPKPAPDVFLYAAEKLETTPQHCLVIEDAVVGIEAAKAAGMHAVGFCGAEHCHDGWEGALLAAGADGILHELTTLPAYLDGLNGDGA